jgi:transposase
MGPSQAEAKRLGIELVFSPPYSPDLNPIEYVWKSIKRIISTTFVRHVDDMRNIVKEAFCPLTRKLSFAATWFDRFLPPYYNYIDFCRSL